MNSPDDAIDLNDCSNIKIKSNYLINNYDKGISIGTVGQMNLFQKTHNLMESQQILKYLIIIY